MLGIMQTLTLRSDLLSAVGRVGGGEVPASPCDTEQFLGDLILEIRKKILKLFESHKLKLCFNLTCAWQGRADSHRQAPDLRGNTGVVAGCVVDHLWGIIMTSDN